MSTDTQQVVSKAWNFAHVLRDDGLSYMAYVEQITFLLFLKMADEQTKPPYNRKPIVPAGYDWASLLSKEGDALEAQYRHILEKLGTQPGMLGEVFKKAKPEIQNPVTLRRLIVDLIEPEKWMSMQADVKGDIYEGLLSKSAAESPKGAGQYFTPRELIKAIVDCVRPTAADTLCDPACGTGGFLLNAYDYVVRHQGKDLDPDEKKHLKRGFVRGWELVPNTARLCIMNLMLHGIDADPCPIVSGKDSLASPPGEKDRVSLLLTNPPFGKKSTIAIVNEEGDLEKEDESYDRPDFWTSTKNKQLNFLQHVKACSRSTAAAPSCSPTTCCPREGQARPCGGSCWSKRTFTPCCGSQPASSTPKASRRTSCSSTSSPHVRSRGRRSCGSSTTAPTFTTRSRRSRSNVPTSTSSWRATTPRTATSASRPGARSTPRAAGAASPTKSCRSGTNSTSTSSGSRTRAWRMPTAFLNPTSWPRRSRTTSRRPLSYSGRLPTN